MSSPASSGPGDRPKKTPQTADRDDRRRLLTWFRWFVVGLLCLWLLTFATVRIAGFRLGFDLDDTLSFSSPVFVRAHAEKIPRRSPEYWRFVNNHFELERMKLPVVMVAVLGKILGFRVDIITARSGQGGERLIEHWRWLADEFHFERDKSQILSGKPYLIFFGDSDSDIREAREAGVPAVRVRRSKESSARSAHHPGKYGEWVLPLSD